MKRLAAAFCCAAGALLVYLSAHGPSQGNLSVLPLMFILLIAAGRLSKE